MAEATPSPRPTRGAAPGGSRAGPLRVQAAHGARRLCCRHPERLDDFIFDQVAFYKQAAQDSGACAEPARQDRWRAVLPAPGAGFPSEPRAPGTQPDAGSPSARPRSSVSAGPTRDRGQPHGFLCSGQDGIREPSSTKHGRDVTGPPPAALAGASARKSGAVRPEAERGRTARLTAGARALTSLSLNRLWRQ